MLAKALLLGTQKVRTSGAHNTNAEHNNVLVIGTRASQRPLQRKWISGITHRHHHAARADRYRFAADCVLVLQLEVILHLPRGQGMLLKVLPLRDSEDDKESGRKRNAAHRRDRLGEEVYDCRR